MRLRNALNPAGITVRSTGDGTIVVLTIAGVWDAALRSEAFRALQRCLDANPAGLVVDLTALHDGDARSTPAWMSVRRIGADLRPPTVVALCVPPEAPLAQQLQQPGDRRWLPIYAEMRQAETALGYRIPPCDRLVTKLAPVPQAPGHARRLVDEGCRAWNLSLFQFSARLIVSELVTNAVRHAGTDIDVTVSRRAGRLHLIVSDQVYREPEVPARTHGTSTISGLYFVQALSARWGTVPTSGGKLVWATPRAL
jgi:hypothetical protein